jgi:uncharacterized membrane protein YoaK (UPF0700 family)
MLIKLHRSAAHVLIFVTGLRLLSGGDVAKRDVILLVVAAMVCIVLLCLWRRAPAKFGHDPDGVAQLLAHGLAIIAVVLATRALAVFFAEWIAVAAVAITAAVLATARRFQQRNEAPWKYSDSALASVSLMGLLAAGILWFGERGL